MPLLACANGEPTSSPDHFGASGSGTGSSVAVGVRRAALLRREAPLPGQRVEVAAERERRGRQHHRAAPEQPLPQQPADPQRRRAQRPVPGAVRALLGQPDDVAALGRVGLVERVRAAAPRCRPPRPAPPGRSCGPVAASGSSRRSPPERLLAGAGGVAHRGQRAGRGLGQRLPAAGRQVLQHQRRGPRPPRRAGRRRPGRRACRSRRAAAATVAGGQLGGGDAGDPVDQLVRLVDDHDVVLGQHRRGPPARRSPAARGW